MLLNMKSGSMNFWQPNFTQGNLNCWEKWIEGPPMASCRATLETPDIEALLSMETSVEGQRPGQLLLFVPSSNTILLSPSGTHRTILPSWN